MSGQLHITDATVYFDGRRLDGVSNVSRDLVEEEFATEAFDLDAASWSIHRSNVLGVWPAAVERLPEGPPPGDVLQRIDEAIAGLCECGCGMALKPDGPSAYYVDEAHQERWQQSRGADPRAVFRRADTILYADQAYVFQGYFRFQERFAPLEFDFPAVAERFVDGIRHLGCAFEALRLARDEPPSDPMERALWLRKHRNTGPRERARVPRRIDATRSR